MSLNAICPPDQLLSDTHSIKSCTWVFDGFAAHQSNYNLFNLDASRTQSLASKRKKIALIESHRTAHSEMN